MARVRDVQQRNCRLYEKYFKTYTKPNKTKAIWIYTVFLIKAQYSLCVCVRFDSEIDSDSTEMFFNDTKQIYIYIYVYICIYICMYICIYKFIYIIYR